MRRMMLLGGVLLAASVGPVAGQTTGPIEIPLRVENNRLIVSVEDGHGAQHDFAVGLGMTMITESGRAAIGDALNTLTVGGVAVQAEQAQTVPDAYMGDDTHLAGVLGGETWSRYDLLLDAPNGRLILKPVGRRVEWPGVELTNPTRMLVFHDVLSRTDVELDGEVFGALLEFARPDLLTNPGGQTRAGFEGPTVASFRMGYTEWTDVPVRVVDPAVFGGWDPQGNGFVFVGSAVAVNCAIAVSWVHTELRTCRTVSDPSRPDGR